MATDINIVEAQNDLETIKKQAEQMRTAFPKTTYMNKGLSKIIGTIDERLNRWDRIAEEDQSVDQEDVTVYDEVAIWRQERRQDYGVDQ
jgi:biotin-(acetyl-CoA carboxylase) ligase